MGNRQKGDGGWGEGGKGDMLFGGKGTEKELRGVTYMW